MASRKQTKRAGLNPKQKLFVAEYLKDYNATQAATRAGYTHPTKQGPRLLDFVGVKSAIAEAQEKRLKRVEINADWVLKRLSLEAEADLADLYEEDGALKPVSKWPLIWRQGLVAGVETDAQGVQKVKLSDRAKRLEMIGKHVNVQAFRDQVKHEGGISLTISQEDAKL
jgi:phage terminase small subunit